MKFIWAVVVHWGAHFRDLSKEGRGKGLRKRKDQGRLWPQGKCCLPWSSERGYRDSKNHKYIISAMQGAHSYHSRFWQWQMKAKRAGSFSPIDLRGVTLGQNREAEHAEPWAQLRQVRRERDLARTLNCNRHSELVSAASWCRFKMWCFSNELFIPS